MDNEPCCWNVGLSCLLTPTNAVNNQDKLKVPHYNIKSITKAASRALHLFKATLLLSNA